MPRTTHTEKIRERQNTLNRKVYDLKDVFPLKTHDFEGVQLSIPNNSHHMLEAMYGDYMQLPDLDHLEPHVQRIEFYDE